MRAGFVVAANEEGQVERDASVGVVLVEVVDGAIFGDDHV